MNGSVLPSGQRLERSNARIGAAAGLVAVVMVGASFAAVPLYRMFCQATGYGGTTQVAAAAPGAVTDGRTFTIHFDANVGAHMPWKFSPDQLEQQVRAGEEGLAFYVAHNPTDRSIRGSAVFNVTPLQAGKYFNKVQCFCFEEQVLVPGQTEYMGVAFFVDPAILKDRGLAELRNITLSYTFYEVPNQQADLGGAANPRAAGAAQVR